MGLPCREKENLTIIHCYKALGIYFARPVFFGITDTKRLHDRRWHPSLYCGNNLPVPHDPINLLQLFVNLMRNEACDSMKKNIQKHPDVVRVHLKRRENKMGKETILIVDDEEDIVELIKYNVKNEGYTILTALTGEQAIKAAVQSRPDLILLDLMLPGIDGLEVTRYLKNHESTSQIPIVMLTAKGEELDIVTGLEMGASDYISKPFSPRILVARIRAILRHRKKGIEQSQDRVKQEGDLIVDREKRLVTIEGKVLDLTFSEFELLLFLLDKKGWVFTRKQIVDAIRGENYAVTERSIDVIIVGLRKKLKQYASAIETVRGVGYRFKE